MNVSSIWAMVIATSSLQVSLYQAEYRKSDLSKMLHELEPDFGLPKVESYDYIVAGGGAAGCIIAGILSEAGFSVLLVEKGGDPVPGIMSPFLPSVKFDRAVNDVYGSFPQKHAGLDKGGVLSVFAGTMLGGSGAHNSMTYVRGSPEMYDEWADLLDDLSFSYRNMLEIYKDMENMTGFLFSEEERRGYYGTNGPLSVETDLPALFGDWFEAGNVLGYYAADLNAHLSSSFTAIQTTTRNGIRETSYTAFIQRRPNPKLTIRRFSNVQKVLIERNEAYGALYLRHGIPQIALAKAEVIITADHWSGIGPSDLLKEAEIPCFVGLPGVGAQMTDQVFVGPTFTLNGNKFPSLRDKDVVSFLSTYPGGRLATGAIGLLAFIRSSISPETGSWPDLRFKLVQDPLIPEKVSTQIAVTRPKSLGYLWFNETALKEGETDSTKIIRPNPALLERKEDLDTLVEGLMFFFNGILETPQFRSLGMSFNGDFTEGCKGLRENSREFWSCFAQRRAGASNQATGTCRMGKEVDHMRVVDTRFRVIEVKRLRVADSSVMPKMSNADMHAPTLALAMKAVRDILRETY